MVVVPVRLRRAVSVGLRFGAIVVPVVSMLSLTSLVPTGSPSATKTASASPSSLGTAGGGTTLIGPGTTVHLPQPTLNPPPMPANEPRPTSRRTPVQPALSTGLATMPQSPATTMASQTDIPPVWTKRSVPSAPTDLVLIQNTALSGASTGEQTSATDEPSVSSFGSNVFYTGNFYAALSTDGGQTFGYINSFTEFPSRFGGFCCDQHTIYEPSQGLTVWELMYAPDGQNNNAVRVAVAKGAAGIASNTWTYWDFLPTDAQLPSGLSFDYPQLAYSSNDLYLTANALNPNGSINASVIFRCPLTQLAAGDPNMACTSYCLNGADTFTPVGGATSTMYWADHRDNGTLQVFSWPENVDWPGVTHAEVAHSPFPSSGYSCPSPDGSNMCGADDWTVHGGWVANGVIGFLWDAAQGQGGLGSFPYPYVHVVEINQATMNTIDEPIIWSSNNAWSYAAVGVNGQGGLGVSLAFSSSQNYPSSAIMVRDNVSPTAWQTLNVQLGTNGPPANRWGDFLTVQPHDGNGLTWVATAFTLQGPCSQNWGPCTSVEPRFLSFGRQSYACLANQVQVSRSPASVRRNMSLSSRTIYLPIVSNGGCV